MRNIDAATATTTAQRIEGEIEAVESQARDNVIIFETISASRQRLEAVSTPPQNEPQIDEAEDLTMLNLEKLEGFETWCNTITHQHTLTFFLLTRLFSKRPIGEWVSIDEEILENLNLGRDQDPTFSKTISKKITHKMIQDSMSYMLSCAQDMNYDLSLKIEEETGKYRVVENKKAEPAEENAYEQPVIYPERSMHSKNPYKSPRQELNGKACTPEVYFLNRMMNHRILSREEELELMQRVKSGDAEARNHMIEVNLKLIGSLLKKRGINQHNPIYPELFQDLFFRLDRALNYFDPTLGTRFSTYAMNVMGRAFFTLLVPYIHVTKLSDRDERAAIQSKALIEGFKQKHGRPPSTEEVQEIMGLDKRRIEHLSNVAKTRYIGDTTRKEGAEYSPFELAVNSQMDEGASARLVENIINAGEEKVTNTGKNERQMRRVGICGELHGYIFEIRKRHGKYPWRGGELEELGRECGISRERVRQIENEFSGDETMFL